MKEDFNKGKDIMLEDIKVEFKNGRYYAFLEIGNPPFNKHTKNYYSVDTSKEVAINTLIDTVCEHLQKIKL